MSEPYEEIVEGVPLLRLPPGARHEVICGRLHARLAPCVATLSAARLLAPRAAVQLALNTRLCPDLALVTTATGKLWLAAEVVSADDHQADTVMKKGLYEDLRVPRLWMIDPRYDNIEVYHGTEYGLMLKGILANHELLTEKLLPGFQLPVGDLFQG